MNGKLMPSTAIVCAVLSWVLAAAVSGETDSAQAGARKILIAMGTTGLEYNVANSVVKQVRRLGFTADTVAVRCIGTRTLTSYAAVLVMDAVEQDRLIKPVRKAVSPLDRAVGPKPYVLISRITGEAWQEGAQTDAVAAASADADADAIAQKLVRIIIGRLGVADDSAQ